MVIVVLRMQSIQSPPDPAATIRNEPTRKLSRCNSTDAVKEFMNEDKPSPSKRKRDIDNGAGMTTFMSDSDSGSD